MVDVADSVAVEPLSRGTEGEPVTSARSVPEFKPPSSDFSHRSKDVAQRLIEAQRDGSLEGLTWASDDRCGR